MNKAFRDSGSAMCCKHRSLPRSEDHWRLALDTAEVPVSQLMHLQYAEASTLAGTGIR